MSNLIKVRFTAAFLFFIYTAIVKYQHAEDADTLFTVGLIFSMGCLALAVYEVVTSHRISRSQKAQWLAGFLLTGWIALLFYAFAGRQRVKDSSESGLQHTS